MANKGGKLRSGNGKRKPLIIGRAILDLGVSNRELSVSINKWRRHKSLVSNEFLDNPKIYRQRLDNIIEKGVKENVDILLLPACTLIWKHGYHLEQYRQISRKVPWVIAGRLRLKVGGLTGRYVEDAVVLRRGRPILQWDPYTVKWLKIGRVDAMLAISSTIKKVYDDETLRGPKASSKSSKAVVAISLGHHQYSTRFGIRTLGKVLRVLKTHNPGRAVVVLSFWAFKRSASRISWTAPNGLDFTRHRIPLGEDGRDDILDILKIK